MVEFSILLKFIAIFIIALVFLDLCDYIISKFDHPNPPPPQ